MRRVALIGTGLIGGSVGLAMARAGIEVVGYDRDPSRAHRAKELGVVSEVASSLADALDAVDAVVVAVPVGAIAAVVVDVLDAGAPVVTDVGSVKAPVVAAVERARPELATRFVAGHPMAGSEQDGLDGADADLFVGATWVLTPTARTDPDAYQALRSLVASLGAEVVAVSPEHHDALVAVVSHVPQLAASTLMDVAADRGEEHATLLRLAAGGFRDMTRIAAGHPGIWPDALLDVLERARRARRSLPVGATVSGPLVELRVPVQDRPGVLAEVTTLAGRLGVNIADLEIAHSMEGQAGVLVLIVAEEGATRLESGLTELGYHVSRSAVS
jgi:prephenate dehydrogenase